MDATMFYPLAYWILLTIGAAAAGMLLRVTYPDCTRTHCQEHGA